MSKRLSIVGSAGVVVVAAFLLVLGLASLVQRLGATVPITGVRWGQTSAGPIALEVEPGGSLAAAGLRDGDRLTHVDGLRVRSVLDANQIGWPSDRRTPVELRFQRGETSYTASFEVATSGRHEPYAYLAIVGFAFWVSGLFIALRLPWIRTAAIYSCLAFCLFLQLTLSHTGQGGSFDRLVYGLDVLAGLLAPAILLHLGVVASRRAVRRPGLWIVAGYTAFGMFLLAAAWLSPLLMGGVYRFQEPEAVLGILDRVEPLFFTLTLIAAAWMLTRSLQRSSTGTWRSQQRWMLWGLGIGFGPFAVLYAVPWALGATELPAWAQFVSVVPMLIAPGLITAALARYRLHDLDLILLRGFAEVSAIFAAFGVYAGVAFLLHEAVSEIFPLSRSAARYVAILVVALTYPQLRHWCKTAVDRAFYRKRYSYRNTLLDWARELNAETELVPLVQRLRSRVRETLGVRRADVLFIVDPGEPIVENPELTTLEADESIEQRLGQSSSLRVELGAVPHAPWARHLFPMKVKGRVRAVLAVAERETLEEPLSTEDLVLMGTLAAHAATAIEAARLLSEVRRRAEEIESLHESQARILESSAVGLLLLDASGTIQAWNRALEEIYGLPRDGVVGRRLQDVFPLAVVRRIERESQAAAPGEQARIFRMALVNRRGERRVVNLTLSLAAEEETVATVLTLDDVTEQVKLEEQMMRQERLASLGLLAAGVAHEINTPLTGISSYTQMLLEDSPPDDPARSVLDKIEAQTRRASGITRSLLNLARPEETVFAELAINETVQEAVQLFEPQMRRGAASLVVRLAENLPPVMGHRGKLQQVLLNLLLNARDAVGQTGTINLTTRSDGEKIVILVEDDGIGIAEADLPGIFDPFFSTKPVGRGTGLGLSISYGIVREHDGEIFAESSPGQGTRFRVELPAVRSAEALG